MPPFLNQTLDKARSFWLGRTLSQRILVAGLAATVILAFGVMVFLLNRPDWKVLYTKVSPEDASRVVQLLEAQKMSYKLEDGGTTILVPTDRVYDARLKVAGEGLVHGQGLGFELFDQIKIGQTDFVQRINYQRALQGELTRTISEFSEVDRARVHLSIPAKSLFIEEDRPATASVVLQFKQGQKLSQKQLMAIVNLVAASVDGLDKSHITIADTRGQVLLQPESDKSMQGLSMAQSEYKATMERSLESRIEQLLTPVVGGPEKVIARVNADLDFSQKTVRKEVYNPEGAVVRSEQRSEESTKGTSSMEGAVPDPNYRGADGQAAGGATQQSSRESRTTNYEINKEELHIVSPVGDLKRLTVSVIVDGGYKPGDKESGGKPVYVPRSEDELTRIRQLVQNAVGYEQTRGDAIEVSNVSFGDLNRYTEPSLMATTMDYAQRMGKPFINGLLIFLFLIMVVRPVVLNLLKPRVAEQSTEEVVGLPSGEPRLALEESVEEEVVDLARRLENAKLQAMQLSDQDLDSAVALLKNWIKQEA